jgi:anaphase-promoting complex subunit 10
MDRYWQSDGPQPHYLNVHFIKLVSISHLRFYVDSKYDESYTPTKMQFLAGTGHHDLQTVCEMDLPAVIRGWTEVDLKHAGGPPALKDNEYIEDDDEYGNIDILNVMPPQRQQILARRKWKRIGTGPTLRCFLLQVRILENNQNGKDTHLRGLQMFARDESYVFTRRKGLSIRSVPNGNREFLNDVNAGLADDMTTGRVTRGRSARKTRASDAVAAALASSTITSPEASIPMSDEHALAELEMRFGEPQLR